MVLRGKGSQQARRKHFQVGGQALSLEELQLEVPISNQYRHLGGLVDGEANLTRRRTAIAGSAYEASKKYFFANPKLPLTTRIALFKVTIDPVYFNLGVWTPHGPAWAKLSQGYSRLLRRMFVRLWGGDEAFHIPLAAVHVMAQAPPLEHLGRRARLSLLCSMSKAAPSELWAMLQQEQTWNRQLQTDLAWLVCSGESSWPAVRGASWPEWAELFRCSTPWFKRQVKRRLKADATSFFRNQAYQLTLWARYRKAREHLGRSSTPTTEWCYRMCSKALKTKAGLGAHFQKTHGRLALYRDLLDGTTCTACGRNFWSANRLMIHLRDSPSGPSARKALTLSTA